MTSARLAEIKKMFTDERVHPRCTLDHDVVAELIEAVDFEAANQKPGAPAVAFQPSSPSITSPTPDAV